MPTKIFAERLNQELDKIGVPQRESERINACVMLFHIPKYTAALYLKGIILPDQMLMRAIADELEVDSDWLSGKS